MKSFVSVSEAIIGAAILMCVVDDPDTLVGEVPLVRSKPESTGVTGRTMRRLASNARRSEENVR